MELFFVWAAYFFVHSLLAHDLVKARLQGKRFPKGFYRVFYNVIALLLLVPVVYCYSETKGQFSAPFSGLHWFGYLGILAGFLVLGSSLRQYDLGEFSGLTQNPQASKLNTSGLNKLVRHPLYLGVFMIIWSFFLATFSWAALITAIVISIYLPVGIYLEEQKLLKVFGAGYESYKKEVPMLFPRIK